MKTKAISNPKRTITQAEMELVEVAARRVSRLQEELKEEQAQLKARQGEVLTRLKAGAKQESGTLRASLDTIVGKCSPKWKEEYLAAMEWRGIDRDAAEAAVSLRYEPSQTEKLVIMRQPQLKAVES
jgi:hypothetical protein